MNIEDIKVGETYNVRVKVDRVDTAFNAVFFTIEGGDTVYAFGVQDRKIHDLISPVIKVEGVCPPPKYDPCRKFRKGDIVRLREYNGRKPYDYWHKQVIKNFGAKLDTVLEDEKDSGNVDIFQDAPIDELTVRVNSCHLELVTPVEELEPYEVTESSDYYGVDKDDLEVEAAIFWKKSHPNAKAAAEAECARLNEEYRKEQK